MSWPRAEIYQYRDPGHPAHGTWTFQIVARPWLEEMPLGPDGRPASHIMNVAGDDIDYPTQADAYSAACRALAQLGNRAA